MKKNFLSYDESHLIIIKKEKDEFWFSIEKIDYEKYKTFLLLLKDVIEYLNDNNVKIINQYVYKNDIEFFQNSNKFEINDNIYKISTNIDNFVSSIYNALGLKPI